MPRRLKTNEEAILARHGMTVGAELGEGTYSKVRHCTWQVDESTSKRIAIKVINKKTAPRDFLQKFLPRELDICRKVKMLKTTMNRALTGYDFWLYF